MTRRLGAARGGRVAAGARRHNARPRLRPRDLTGGSNPQEAMATPVAAAARAPPRAAGHPLRGARPAPGRVPLARARRRTATAARYKDNRFDPDRIDTPRQGATWKPKVSAGHRSE